MFAPIRQSLRSTTITSQLARSIRTSSIVQSQPLPSNPVPTSTSSPLASEAETQTSASNKPESSKTTHFGFKTVPEAEKEGMVRGVFSSVASSYDVMNDAMSLGIHRLWKDDFVSTLNPGGRGRQGWSCLDVAGGTGDIAERILDHARLKHADRDVKVEILDINKEMLAEGEKRFRKTMYHGGPQISFTHGNAQALDIPSASKDLYTISFGIRNCTDIPAVLEEAYRVLKPGGIFCCMEFGKVTNPLFAGIYRQYSFSMIPLLGQILASDRDSYQYLIESIERFPSQPDFAQMIREAGFQTGEMREGEGGAWRDLTGGIASIHTAVKL
ncbi:coq5 methyltransferase [Phaffia rhodozyma]|uniref:2-methoxy-6-polyprenyl-1,4-benzoquinol methylase, mitochondrial n=1 Tax=Phaffia rhodozyma TaxID=264483 RepID=A0A0F7SMK3_PHARH|nr:coq5 methyltransferase [Phaffia rhodozyma]